MTLRPGIWLGASALAIVAAALAGPRIVPLYDGLGFPDQPYEFVGQDSPPLAVQQDIPAASLAGAPVTIQSNEFGPQVKIVLAHGAVTLPSGARHVVISLTPETITVEPSSGSIAGNVYLIAATTGSASPAAKPGSGTVYLRLPQGISFTSPPFIVFRHPGGQWRSLTTEQPGADIYSVSFAGWGEYAMAFKAQGQAGGQTSQPQAKRRTSALWLTALIVGLILVIIAVIRIANAPKHGPHKKN